MPLALTLVLLLPSLTVAQPTAEQKKATIKWVTDLQDPMGGFYLAPPAPNIDAIPSPGLRATSGAVRALKYLGAEVPNKDKHAAFVLKCYDPATGGFAEPGGKPDVTITSIGVMAAMELGIPKEKFAKAMDYLKENAKTFEEVRIAAAAVEAWGVKDCPFDVKLLIRRATELGAKGSSDQRTQQDGGARAFASVIATVLRLGSPMDEGARKHCGELLRLGQRDDGGWGKTGAKSSDIESTYRVMRALVLLGQRPDLAKVRKFVDAHRNDDGGYGLTPDDQSSMSGVYYAVIITKWLNDMEKK